MRESKKLRLLCLAALFAGAIAVTTAYLLHIPIPTGGYIHLGDALIYLAACLLPAPYAVGAAMVGAGLADLLTAPLWVVPTLLIKALVALLFTSRGPGSSAPGTGRPFCWPACSPRRPTAWPPACCWAASTPSGPSSWARWYRRWAAGRSLLSWRWPWTGQAVKPGSLPTARADFSTRLVPRVENFPLPNALERCYPILTRGGIVMKRVKITVLKTTLDRELAEEYGAEGLTACPMLREGQVFYADYAKPEGFCDEAWKAVYQYAFALAHGAGEGLFYYGDWIRKPGVAICSCNDGLRPVIFKLEATDEEAVPSYTPVR